MEICKVTERYCKNAPICAYRDNEYVIPEVFAVSCSFYAPEEVEEETLTVEMPDGNITIKAEWPAVEVEPEKDLETLKQEIDKWADELDELPDQDNSTGKYPAKRTGKTGLTDEQKAEIVKLYSTTKPVDIAKKMGLGKSTVYNYIKEAREAGLIG